MAGYLRDLWTGALPLGRILVFDMLAVGTLVNVLTMIAMIVLLAADVPTAAAIAIFLAPLPYNVVLFTGVWRSSARDAGDWAWLARGVAGAWLVGATLI